MLDKKRCKGCGEIKPHSEFHRHNSNSDGLRSRCRMCRSAENIARRAETRQYFADYYRRNSDRIRARVNEWRRAASGEKLSRYDASVKAGGERFRKTWKGELATTRSNLSKITGVSAEMLDDAIVEAKALQLRVVRRCRAANLTTSANTKIG